MSSAREKYNELREIIRTRQAFESLPEQQVAPYSNHRTTINFMDFDGNALIHYAASMGDVTALQELLREGADMDLTSFYHHHSPLKMALHAGHLDAAKLLFEKGARCDELLTAEIHENCRAWFNDRIRESLAVSFPDLTNEYQTIKDKSRFFASEKSISPFVRVAELGDLDYLEKINRAFHLDKLKGKLIITAISNGHLNITTYLLELDESLIHKMDESEDSLLHLAAKYQHPKIVEFLLAKNADVNARNMFLQTPLMQAIQRQDIQLVKLLIAGNADITLTDIYGDTIFHYLRKYQNQEIENYLMTLPASQQLKAQKNLYGMSPMDNADVMIQQSKLNKRFNYFLRLNYRDAAFIGTTGKCNGLTALYLYYRSRGKKEYFFNVLKMIAQWNGDRSILKQPFPAGLPQRQFYLNLSELMDQWIQDINFLQQSQAVSGLQLYTQEDRVRQFQLINPLNDRMLVKNHYAAEYKKLSNAQLTEMLALANLIPTGECIEISCKKHVAAAYTNEHELEYHDVNFLHEVEPFHDEAELAELIKNTLLSERRNLELSDDIFWRMYRFKEAAEEDVLDAFNLFMPDEMPHHPDDDKRYQDQSPNRFTHLHAAVCTGSITSFRKLLTDGFCDLYAVNAHQESVFDMALKSGNPEFLRVILTMPMSRFDIGLSMQCEEFRDYAWYQDYLKHASVRDKLKLLLHAINFNNISFTEKFIVNYPGILNDAAHADELPLLAACAQGRKEITVLLLKAGASPWLLSSTTRDRKKISCLGYVSSFDSACRDVVYDHADLNTLDDSGMAAIHFAATRKNANTIRQLAARSVNVDLLNRNGKSALQLLLESDNRGESHKVVAMNALLAVRNSGHLIKLIHPRTKLDEVPLLLSALSINLNDPMHQSVLAFLLYRANKAADAPLFEKILAHCSVEVLHQLCFDSSIMQHAMNGKNKDITVLVQHFLNASQQSQPKPI